MDGSVRAVTLKLRLLNNCNIVMLSVIDIYTNYDYDYDSDYDRPRGC
jgi:hypothetical protein